MNILFYLSCTPNPLNGGIERVSYILAKEFTRRGCVCYCAYYMENDPEYVSDVYQKSYFIPLDSDNQQDVFERILLQDKIDVVINQLAYVYSVCDIFDNLKARYGRIKLITCYHNNPFISKYQIKPPEYRGGNIVKRISYMAKKCISSICPPLLMNYIDGHYKKRLTRDLPYVDYYVYLSRNYEREIRRRFSIRSSKVISIPNPATYDTCFDLSDYGCKEKIVLFIGRYDEYQKRISEILRIWKSIERGGYDGWRLVLCGHGSDIDLYRSMIESMKINNVELNEKVDPYDFYRRASMFVMTSTYEGWPMALIESMQMGCVPICYDTFLASSEIISDGENGYLVRDMDRNGFRDRIVALMNDVSLCKRIAQRAIDSTREYHINCIADKWMDIFRDGNR